MTSTMMNIPKIINVGYQDRDDTYTKKLAYVVYTDAKGKLRKETSWCRWCDDKIPKDVFGNVPTEGFVLNKGVGGTRQSWGWNVRNEYIRVYDPRDFEFETSVANLLFILQECSSIKGKGLEGEFVYAWEGKELVLLPCCSKEYEECVKYTENQSTKVTKEDIMEGCTYQMRDMKNVMYLGRHPWFSLENDWSSNANRKYLKPCGKKHIFLNIDSQGKEPDYVVESGFTRLAKRTSEEAISDYANAYEKMINSFHCLLPTKVIFEKVNIKESDLKWSGKHVFIKEGDKYYSSYICHKSGFYNQKEGYVIAKAKKSFTIPEIKDGSININAVDFNRYSDNVESEYSDKEIEFIKTFSELQPRDFYIASMVNEKGASYNLMEN